MPYVWAECERERQGRQWLFGGCLDFFLNTNLWGGRERQTDRERRKECAPTHDHVGGKEWWVGFPVSETLQKLFDLHLTSHPQPFSHFSAPFQSACRPLSVSPCWFPATCVFFSGRGAVYSQSCRVNQWNALLHCRSVGWAAPAPLPNTQTHKPRAPRLSGEPVKDNEPASAESWCKMHGNCFASESRGVKTSSVVQSKFPLTGINFNINLFTRSSKNGSQLVQNKSKLSYCEDTVYITLHTWAVNFHKAPTIPGSCPGEGPHDTADELTAEHRTIAVLTSHGRPTDALPLLNPTLPFCWELQLKVIAPCWQVQLCRACWAGMSVQ